MNNFKLSIIIPIYKVEIYIRKCIDSCLNQSPAKLGEDYEIICVNDGSPDNSSAIAKEYALRNKGITVIDQKNMGLSAARNTGLNKAKGDYIWFIDSDDWIDEGCINSIIPLLSNIDILHLQYRLAYDNEKFKDVPLFKINGIIDGRTQIITMGYVSPAQFSIYRRHFLFEHSLKFYEGIIHEDSEFKPRVVLLAERVASYDSVCYNYYQREGSIMSTYKYRNAHDMLIALDSVYRFVSVYDMDVKKAIYSKIGMLVNNILSGIKFLNKEDAKKVILMLKRYRHLFKAMMISDQLKYRIEGMMLYINARFASSLYSRFYNK